jgi:hypothetical protein
MFSFVFVKKTYENTKCTHFHFVGGRRPSSFVGNMEPFSTRRSREHEPT